MERVAFLIEDTNERISCLLNPEDRAESFTVERSSGAARDNERSLYGRQQSDTPVVFRNQGDTRLKLRLLFDVALVGSSIQTQDVRELTGPIWRLAEYAARGRQKDGQELPRVRFIWGKAWDIRVVVEAVAERFERFAREGVPQRSWMNLSLLRVTDEVPKPVESSGFPPQNLPAPETLQTNADPNWGVHEFIGGGTQGDALWLLASQEYGDPSLWRLIAAANDIADPLNIQAGKLLRIPPHTVLRGAP